MFLSVRIAMVVSKDFCVRRSSDRQGIGEEGGMYVISQMLNDLVNDFRLKDAAVETDASHTFILRKGYGVIQNRFLFPEFLGVEKYGLVPVLFSNHRLLSCKVDLGIGVKFGTGLWKLNVSVLEEEEVCWKFGIYWHGSVDFSNVLLW